MVNLLTPGASVKTVACASCECSILGCIVFKADTQFRVQRTYPRSKEGHIQINGLAEGDWLHGG